MRHVALVSIVFALASTAFGQVAGVGTVVVPVPQPFPLPPVFAGFSNTVMDQSGNVLIFDSGYSLPPGVMVGGFSTKTHVTVVSSDGLTKNSYDFDGSFQI